MAAAHPPRTYSTPGPHGEARDGELQYIPFASAPSLSFFVCFVVFAASALASLVEMLWPYDQRCRVPELMHWAISLAL